MSIVTPAICIQRAGLRDYGRMCSLFREWNVEQVQKNPELYRVVENGIGRWAYWSSVWGQRKVFMMALSGNECVGVSAIEKIDRPNFRAAGGEYSVTIMVSPGHRRSGIGERLLNSTLMQVRGADVSCRLPSGSSVVEPFFKNSGFWVSRVIYGKAVNCDKIAKTVPWRDSLARPDEADILRELFDSDQRNIASITRFANRKFYPLPSMVEVFNAIRYGRPDKSDHVVLVKRGEDGVSIEGMLLAHQRIVDEQTWYHYPRFAVIDAVAVAVDVDAKTDAMGNAAKTASWLVEHAAAWAVDKGCSYLRHERQVRRADQIHQQWYGGLRLEGVRMNCSAHPQKLNAAVLD